MESSHSSPRPALSIFDAVAILVGVVVGAGIFRTPSLVAGAAGSSPVILWLWLAGGLFSLVGALCYAELCTSHPNAGGEYHYLFLAFGPAPAFLFAWARMTVIQTGCIAMMAFLVGEYLDGILPLGRFSGSWYAAGCIVMLTGLNLLGIRQGKWMQNVLTVAIVAGLLGLVVAAFQIEPATTAAPAVSVAPGAGAGAAGIGMAMVFVLLTYGGWNEAAYLSAEVRRSRRGMLAVLVLGILVVTLLYLAVNYALLRALGPAGAAQSQAVAADALRLAAGEAGALSITLLVVVAALSTMNATMITGARTNYALGRDFAVFRPLGGWSAQSNTPRQALLVQGGISLMLVLFGTGARSGFQAMVEFTAPIFWLFFLLTGISLFVLRRTRPNHPRPFKVPFYPWMPIIFCAGCVYMLKASLAYTGRGALLGVAVLAAGTPFLIAALRRQRAESWEKNAAI